MRIFAMSLGYQLLYLQIARINVCTNVNKIINETKIK